MKLTRNVKQRVQGNHWEVNTIEARKIIARKQRKTSHVFNTEVNPKHYFLTVDLNRGQNGLGREINTDC